MEPALVLLITFFFMASIYLLLSKHVIRMLLGIALIGNGVNLLIFTAGRLTHEVPPIIVEAGPIPALPTANPLPQALILTAIVISFSFFAFLLVLSYRAYQDLKTDDTTEMRIAEPIDQPPPPGGY
jgi:multicomponent Na+:H+ antiporter subunit C